MRNSKIWIYLLVCCFPATGQVYADSNDESLKRTQDQLAGRLKTAVYKYFSDDSSSGALPNQAFAVDLFNDGVEFFKAGEYEFAKEAFLESLKHHRQNSMAYEMLGEIEYREQDLKAALDYYKKAFALDASKRIREKIEKIEKEETVESDLSTYHEEHFLIKYKARDEAYEGYELKDMLFSIYRNIAREFSYYLKHKTVVLLYSEEEFKHVSGSPHWVGGLYDGKVRLPAYDSWYDKVELRAIATHEVVHAFTRHMAQGASPTWLNEGIAQYLENKVRPIDLTVFNAAVKTDTFLPIDELLISSNLLKTQQDPLWISLFYQQSFMFVSYIVDRYSMYHVKNMFLKYPEYKDSEQVIREVLKISPEKLYQEWKNSL